MEDVRFANGTVGGKLLVERALDFETAPYHILRVIVEVINFLICELIPLHFFSSKQLDRNRT